jgi:hypothetical protein
VRIACAEGVLVGLQRYLPAQKAGRFALGDP